MRPLASATVVQNVSALEVSALKSASPRSRRHAWFHATVNNREIASLVWLAVALAAALFSRDIRSAFWAVAKSFVHLKIGGPLLLLAAWVAGLVAVAHGLGLWEATERNDTIVWFVTVGIAFYFSLDK